MARVSIGCRLLLKAVVARKDTIEQYTFRSGKLEFSILNISHLDIIGLVLQNLSGIFNGSIEVR